MKKLLANPYVGRLGGAIAAALTAFAFQHDAKAALVTGVSFIVYGAAHTTSTEVAK